MDGKVAERMNKLSALASAQAGNENEQDVAAIHFFRLCRKHGVRINLKWTPTLGNAEKIAELSELLRRHRESSWTSPSSFTVKFTKWEP